MHHTIYQFSDKPIAEANYISTRMFDDEHWFLRTIADRVDDSNRDVDIDILTRKAIRTGFTVDKDNNKKDYLLIKDKHRYFIDKYTHFHQVAHEMAQWTISDFINHRNINRIRYAFAEKFEDYVVYEGGLIPFDEFMRIAKEDVKYYIGGTLDYHW